MPFNDLYPESYYGEQRKDSWLNKIFVTLYQAERQHTLSIHARSDLKILDMGCGDGTFLEYLPKSCKKFGYEPSAVGKNELALKKDIQLMDIMNRSSSEITSFDIITFWQSLEHITEPDDILQSARGLLKDKGILFISVPNIDSWQAKMFGGKWFHLDPIRHFFHYTPETLTRLLERNHFVPLGFTTISWEYGLFGWWQSFYNILGFEFNMLYKILKRREKYPCTPKNVLALAAQAILAFPVVVVSLILFSLESILQHGGTINLKARKNERYLAS